MKTNTGSQDHLILFHFSTKTERRPKELTQEPSGEVRQEIGWATWRSLLLEQPCMKSGGRGKEAWAGGRDDGHWQCWMTWVPTSATRSRLLSGGDPFSQMMVRLRVTGRAVEPFLNDTSRTLLRVWSPWGLWAHPVRETNPWSNPDLNTDLRNKVGREMKLTNSLQFYNRKCLWENAFLLWHGKTTRRALGYFLSLSFHVQGFSPAFPAPSSQYPNLPFTVAPQGLRVGPVSRSE